MTEKKRVNFTSKDQDLLLALVSKESDLTCMKTDNRTVVLKKAAWRRITEKFNTTPTTQTIRTEKQLIKLWNNIKNRYKGQLADNKRRTSQTGGVIECTVVENPNIEMVLGNVDCELRGAIDSDTISLQNTVETPVHSQLENNQKRYDLLPSSSSILEQLAEEVEEEEEEEEQMQYETTNETMNANGTPDALNVLMSVTPRDGERKAWKRTRDCCVEEVTNLQLSQMKELHELKKTEINLRIAAAKAKKAAAQAEEAYFISKKKKLLLQSTFMMFEEMSAFVHNLQN